MKAPWIAMLALALGATAPAWAQTQPSPKGSEAHIRAATARIDGSHMRTNAVSTKDWPSYGLDYAETRFSKLDQINDKNVKELGLVWSYNLESTRGVEATPLVVDGIMYVTASWSVVHAVDVRTGKRLWTYDPKVPREVGVKGCCDVVNRGVALYRGKVFVGSFDARLVAARRRHRQGRVGERHLHRPQQAVHHHRRAACLQGQGDHRQRRRRVRRARLHHGL